MLSDGISSSVRASCIICFYVIIVLMWLEAAIATIANVLAIMAFFKAKQIRRKVSNYFILNLSLADLLVGAVVIPINNVAVYYGYWPFGKVVCKLWLLLVYACTALSGFALALISWDRYLWVKEPLVYIHRQSKKRAIIVIVATVLVSYVYVSVVDIGWEAVAGVSRINYSNTCESEGIYSVPYAITTFIFELLLPVGLLATFNTLVFIKIRKTLLLRQRAESGTITLGANRKDRAESSTSCYSSGDSNQQNFNSVSSPKPFRPPGPQAYRKSAIMLGLMTGAFVVCWCPWFIVVFVNATNGGDYVSLDLLWGVSYLMFANSAINPFLYASTNVHYKAQMLSFCCFFRRR